MILGESLPLGYVTGHFLGRELNPAFSLDDEIIVTVAAFAIGFLASVNALFQQVMIFFARALRVFSGPVELTKGNTSIHQSSGLKLAVLMIDP